MTQAAPPAGGSRWPGVPLHTGFERVFSYDASGDLPSRVSAAQRLSGCCPTIRPLLLAILAPAILLRGSPLW